MDKICIFGGTAEGRRLAAYLKGSGVSLLVCVATEYGEELVPEGENITVSAKRLSFEEMLALFEKEGFSCVIDATHPYAREVSENLKNACTRENTPYLRLLRGESATGGAVTVSSAREAAEYLKGVSGKVLLTTGSREIAEFSTIPDFENRFYARVLPSEESITACVKAGLLQSHITALQGPFSEEMNIALLKHTGAEILVTKDGGKAGGFPEKAAAAKALGVRLLVISRPEEKSEGKSFGEVCACLAERFGVKRRPRVSVIGIGPGAKGAFTNDAERALSDAECVIGAPRMLELAPACKAVFAEISPEKIADIIEKQTEYTSFAVLFSGDTGFYSGAKKLLPRLENARVEVFPGVSSVSYFCSKTGESYDGAAVLSLHGRDADIVRAVRENKKTFALTGGENTPAKICEKLCAAGLSALSVTVGERLSYEDERVSRGSAEEMRGKSFDSLSVMLIENPGAKREYGIGVPDGEFLRSGGEKTVPMTKAEVRAVCISKMRLCDDSVVWDIGAGTGSVTVEAALLCPRGRVYAVEKSVEALDILNENIKKFGITNAEVIAGFAPLACEALPAPDRVFLGGSSGNIKDIIKCAFEKNPRARVVAAAISLETVSELTACLKGAPGLPALSCDAVCVNVSRAKRVGEYDLMTAQNPVYVFAFEGKEEV